MALRAPRPAGMNAAGPLASVLIPAYHERFFGEAFASALAQSHAPLEIVVCDDSPGTAIGAAVERAADARVRYVRNARNLGFAVNFTQCFRLARGELVKFLNDDDRLRPDCVAILAAALAADPSLTLATSRRGVIDEEGRAQPDVAGTTPISHVSGPMDGRKLGDFVLVNSMNLIGEPSTVLFRRDRVDLEGDSLFRWREREYHCLADLSLWLRLLAKGPAYYHSTALSEYRRHAGQEQGGIRLACLYERLWIVGDARTAGFLALPAAHRLALEAVRARAAAWVEAAASHAEMRSRAASFLAQVEREIGEIA